jgi:hypothetical protein
MKTNKQISQTTLKKYRRLENAIAELTVEFKDLKDDIIMRLDDGTSVEIGERTADIQSIERRSVSWKQVVIRLKDAAYATRVLAATKPTFFFKLTVR